MAAGGGRRWQDDLEPDLRPLVRQHMVAELTQMFKADQRTNPEKICSCVANFEEGTFRTAQSKEDYMRRMSMKIQTIHENQQRELQAAAKNRWQQMQIAYQMQLGNPVQVIQGSNSWLTATPQAAYVMSSPVWPPSQHLNWHMAGPNMQIRPSNMMSIVNQNFNSHFATFAPVAPGVQSGQQIVQSVPMQSWNECQAVQLQRTSFGSYNQASVAQLQGQPVVRPNAQPNHLLNQNASGICGVQQQPMHLIRNLQGLGVNQHHTNSQWYHMVGGNNVIELNIGYPGGLNCQQNVGFAAGLQSSLEVCKQEVLKKQTNMESQLITPACGQVTVNQQGNVYCPSPQTPVSETMNHDEAIDWREAMFQQIESWKAAYLSELMELNRIFVIQKTTEEQLQSLPKYKAEGYKRISGVKSTITDILEFLQLQKSEIPETHREKLPKFKTAIHELLDRHKKIKAHIEGINIRQESQDHHVKPQTIYISQDHVQPQTIDLTGDTAQFNGGKSSQQNQPKKPADANISQTRQNVVLTTSPSHQKTDTIYSHGVKSPLFSVKSPGGLQSSPKNDVGASCNPSPTVARSGVVQVASPCGSLNSTSQSPIAKPGVETVASPCASMKSSLTSTVDKPRIQAAASPCSSVMPTLLSNIATSGVVPVASPCDSVNSTAPDGINNYHQVTPSKLIGPASPGLAQTPASETEDEECGRAKTTVAKKPIDRLLDAVRASSPAVLRSSVNSIKLALIAMDSVPLPPWRGSNSKMKRAYDITSSYSESPPLGSLDISSAEYHGEHGAKRQKAQNAKEVLLDEIEAINSKLIDTTISIPGGIPADGFPSCNSGTLIKLLYTSVSLAPSLKSHLLTSGMQPLVMPVTLLVPAGYPASSPTIICDEGEQKQLRKKSSSISEEVDVVFRSAFRVLPEPRSLKEIASLWDTCVRLAVANFVQQLTGGAPGSRLGQWESCGGA